MANRLDDNPIKKRAVLYTRDKGLYRFLGWAITTTRLGNMAEPFLVNDRLVVGTSVRDHDPSDPIARIDELRNIAPGMESHLMNSDGEQIHGGDLLPRTTIRTGYFDAV